MRRHFVRLAVVAVILCGASVAIARLNGPPRSVTGAPAVGIVAAESNCTFCHDPANGLNDPSGLLEFVDVPDEFALDTDYVIKMRLAHTWNPMPIDSLRWGFEATVVRSDSGTGYGAITPGPGTQLAIQNLPGQGHPSRQYVSHTGAGTHAGSLGPVEWSFTWRSPSYAASKVYFFASGNSANGDFLSSGDFIFTAADSSTYANVGVGDAVRARTELAAPSPNPARGYSDLSFALGNDGAMDLGIFDSQGRRVRTLIRGTLPAGPGRVRWDGRDDRGQRVAGGVYFARLVAPEAAAQMRKVVLTH